MERAETIPKGSRAQAGSKRPVSECRECGATKRRIQGHGLCERCYQRQWRKSIDHTKWNSKDFPDGCVKCGTTARRHGGQGLCRLCYQRKYHTAIPRKQAAETPKQAERRRVRVRERYKTNPEFRRKCKEHQFNLKYNGNGITCLQRDNYMCTSCGYSQHPRVLEIHHIDRNRKNNELGNLLTVCPTCHKEIHYESNGLR